MYVILPQIILIKKVCIKSIKPIDKGCDIVVKLSVKINLINSNHWIISENSLIKIIILEIIDKRSFFFLKF